MLLQKLGHQMKTELRNELMHLLVDRKNKGQYDHERLEVAVDYIYSLLQGKLRQLDIEAATIAKNPEKCWDFVDYAIAAAKVRFPTDTVKADAEFKRVLADLRSVSDDNGYAAQHGQRLNGWDSCHWKNECARDCICQYWSKS
jgi:hypothetical protein